jgi:dimeric dUTPase (all-alpha-NTP-PPase superfamily)
MLLVVKAPARWAARYGMPAGARGNVLGPSISLGADGGNNADNVAHPLWEGNVIFPRRGACQRESGLPSSPAMDKLEEIFRMQDALNKRIGVELPPPTDEEKAKWILNYTRAMQQETAELIDSVPWKWWAKYQKFDEQNAKVEVVDLFHFLVSLAQTLGMTPDDVYQAYLKKNAVNHQRQDSGYVKKDEADSKHI